MAAFYCLMILYMHTHYIHKISVFGGSVRGKNMKIRTSFAKKLKQWSRVALSVCFTHLISSRDSHLI